MIFFLNFGSFERMRGVQRYALAPKSFLIRFSTGATSWVSSPQESRRRRANCTIRFAAYRTDILDYQQATPVDITQRILPGRRLSTCQPIHLERTLGAEAHSFRVALTAFSNNNFFVWFFL